MNKECGDQGGQQQVQDTCAGSEESLLLVFSRPLSRINKKKYITLHLSRTGTVLNILVYSFVYILLYFH